MSKYILLFLFFTLLSAQSDKVKVHGSVVECISGNPMPGTIIMIVDSETGDVADEEGHFNLALMTGKNILKISCIGYNTILDTININNRNTIELSYKMEPAPFEMAVDKSFGLLKKDALRDILENNFRIFISEYDDSIKAVTDQVASKYGFKVYWPEEVYMIITVNEYNDTMIKYLEKQNGQGWYERFLSDLNEALGMNK